ncbi:MAG: isoleucine--tRNA ligase, partial [Planctomycetota bacterium]
MAVHPHLDYVTLRYEKDGRRFISVVAAERVETVAASGGLGEGRYSIGERKVRGSELEGLRYEHPFVEQNPTDKDAYMLILADYVTTDDGTGLVHTAPGHGLEDYMSGQKHGLAVYSPVMDDGRYDDTVPDWLRGRSVLEVDAIVNNDLKRRGWLFAQGQISH